MKLSRKLAVLGSALFLSGVSVTAMAAPSQCPDVNVIKSEGIGAVEMLMENLYFGLNFSTYNTDSPWYFIIGMIEADDEEMALDEANELLTTLSGNPTPEEDPDGDVGCLYNLDDDEHLAVAISVDNMVKRPQFRRYFHK